MGENRCGGAVWANRAKEKPFSLHWERRKSTCIFMTWKIMGGLSVFLRVFDDFVVKCGASRIDYHICGRENGFA